MLKAYQLGHNHLTFENALYQRKVFLSLHPTISSHLPILHTYTHMCVCTHRHTLIIRFGDNEEGEKQRIWTWRDVWESTLHSPHSPGWPSARERIRIEMRSREQKKHLPLVPKCSDPRVVLGLSGLKSLKINWGASIYRPMSSGVCSIFSCVESHRKLGPRGRKPEEYVIAVNCLAPKWEAQPEM